MLLSRSASVASIAAACVALSSRDARAQSAESTAVPANSVALNWVRLPGAESCSAPQVIARQVQARVGGEVFVSVGGADWSIEGRIERRGRTWVATLSAARAPGESAQRIIERIAPDCVAIDEQIVTVVALMLDANAVRPRVSTAPTVQPLVAPDRPPVTREVRVEVPVLRERVVEREAIARRAGAIELGLGGAFEALPQPTFAAQIAGEWAVLWPVLRLRGALWLDGPSVDTAVWSAGRESITAFSTGASVAVCLSLARAPWVALCPGISGGAAVGFGGTGSTRRTAVLPTVAAIARLQGELPLSRRWSIGVWSEFSLGILRPRFAVVEGGTQRVLAESAARSPVSLSGGLSISLVLGPEIR